MKIRKKSGELEEYDRGKLERSILKAGGSVGVAKRVCDLMLLLEGLSTSDLRRRVGEELIKRNPALAGAYLSTRRLTVRSDPNLAEGTAGMNQEYIVGLASTPEAALSNVDSRTRVSLHSVPTANPSEIRLNRADLDKLGAKEGSRILVRYPDN